MSSKKRLRETAEAPPAAVPVLGEFEPSRVCVDVIEKSRKNSAQRRLLERLRELDLAGEPTEYAIEDSSSEDGSEEEKTPLHVSSTFIELFGTIIRASEDVGHQWKLSLGKFGFPRLEFLHEKRIADEGLRRFCRRSLVTLWAPAADPNNPFENSQQFGADVMVMQVTAAQSSIFASALLFHPTAPISAGSRPPEFRLPPVNGLVKQ